MLCSDHPVCYTLNDHRQRYTVYRDHSHFLERAPSLLACNLKSVSAQLPFQKHFCNTECWIVLEISFPSLQRPPSWWRGAIEVPRLLNICTADPSPSPPWCTTPTSGTSPPSPATSTQRWSPWRSWTTSMHRGCLKEEEGRRRRRRCRCQGWSSTQAFQRRAASPPRLRLLGFLTVPTPGPLTRTPEWLRLRTGGEAMTICTLWWQIFGTRSILG